MDARAPFEIVNRLGMHARAATKLVQTASRFRSDVQIEKDGHVANAKSVMGVLLLCGAAPPLRVGSGWAGSACSGAACCPSPAATSRAIKSTLKSNGYTAPSR